MLGGSAYWESDRAKRGQFDELSEEKRRKEKRDAWIRELEIREEEEEELKRLRDNLVRGRAVEKAGLAEETARKVESAAKERDAAGRVVRSAFEAGDREGPVMAAVRGLWQRR
jgi:hypothetical protein